MRPQHDERKRINVQKMFSLKGIYHLNDLSSKGEPILAPQSDDLPMNTNLHINRGHLWSFKEKGFLLGKVTISTIPVHLQNRGVSNYRTIYKRFVTDTSKEGHPRNRAQESFALRDEEIITIPLFAPIFRFLIQAVKGYTMQILLLIQGVCRSV